MNEKQVIKGTGRLGVPTNGRARSSGIAARFLACLVALASVLCVPSLALGADVSVVAALNTTRVSVGDSVVLHLVVDGASDATPPASLSIEGCEVEYLGGQNQSSQSISIVNGVRREQTTERFVMQYRLTPLREGKIIVPPVQVDVGGVKHTTEQLAFNALKPQEDDDFRLDLTLEKDECYEGEPIRATLVWYLSHTDVREFRVSGFDGGDEFDIAPAPGFEELTRQQADRANLPFLRSQISGRLSRETINGRPLTALTSELLITPKKAGTRKIGPFRVSFAVRTGGRGQSIFDFPLDDAGARQRRVATSQERELRVKPLPLAGRPRDFGGLVGEFVLAASADAREASVGDPITLTLRIAGTPPLDRVAPPPISHDEAFTSGFRVDPEGWKDAGTTSAGRTFTTTLRPTSPSVKEIPALSLAYFDAKAGAYSVARSAPVPLSVRAARELTAADAVRSDPGALPVPQRDARPLIAGAGGLRANHALETLALGDATGAVGDRARAGLAISILAPPVIVGALALWRWKRGLVPSSAGLERAAMRRARGRLRRASEPEAIAGAIRGYIADVRGVPSPAMTSSDCERLGGERASELARVLASCERARYGDPGAAIDELRARALGALDRPAIHSPRPGGSLA